MPTTEEVSEGKYKFKITRNIQDYNGKIISHTYKIGGDYPDCVNISYTYHDNKPISAKLPHLLYEPECAIGSSLEKGSGTELMIKNALKYAYKDVPSISIFEFDDDSHIDCVEKNIAKPPPRKPTKPVNLAYFYIAYHGMTWYEARFNAKMKDSERYKAYQNSLTFLIDPKQKLPFIRFIEIIGGSFSSTERITELEKYYIPATTYREFFQNIQPIKRCDMLYGWINTFMEHYIRSIFSDKGWYINILHMESKPILKGGGALSNRLHYRIFPYKKITNF
jgi:hypothetical protein